MINISREFENMAGIPDVIGAVDGCHIPISAPTDHPESYINRHDYHSILLQGICDHERRFTDVFAGCCGSLHDARVLQRSPINQESTDHYNDYFPNQTHILGDKAYTPQFNVLPPYKDYGNLTPVQRNFNFLHSQTRQIIERTFALLLSRFRRLKYLYLQNIEYAALNVLACCCLHNLCLNLNDELDDDDKMNFESIRGMKGNVN
ncbi:putative nuclease HARBI1 [Leptopilina boulardi]|uniref:putative nuclease HARBI1 n=1 Tax=Leptopilina boulardi TaxID=63433 RepID=UPI0021F5C427|nr:putative nuclease HARBI1 [Leptopilina boulardi]